MSQLFGLAAKIQNWPLLSGIFFPRHPLYGRVRTTALEKTGFFVHKTAIFARGKRSWKGAS